MSEKETACLRDITETDIMEYMPRGSGSDGAAHATRPRHSSGFWRRMRRQTTRCSMKCRRKW